MSVKAVVVLRGFITPTPEGGAFSLGVRVAGIEPGNVQNFDQSIPDLSPTITALTLEQTVKDAVKERLISQYGYTFGVLDTVRLIGATL